MEHELSAAQRTVHRQLQAGLQQIGYDIQFYLQGHAPVRTEHLKHSIDMFMRRSTHRPQVVILIDVQDEDHPYDYVNVTRFGRRAVVAKRPAKPSKVLGTKPILYGRELKRYSASALKFTPQSGDGPIYRRRVKAWRPPGGDWIARTAPEASKYADEMMDEVADYIHSHLRRGRSKGRLRFSGGRRVRMKVLR
jgi:hypothetical protein